MSHHAVLETVCGNCGAELQGAFCHACGQKVTGPDVSLHDFFHEAFHEFAHLDGKIVQTLRLLMTKPGMLTKEFLEGRRARYISPLRLYLTCSLLFFALAALTAPAILVYHYLSLRRVFGGSRLATAWKGTLLAITYVLIIFSTMVAVGLRSVTASGIPTPVTTEVK